MARQSKTKTYEPDQNRFVFRASGIEVPTTKGDGKVDLMHVSEQDAREWTAAQTRPDLEKSFLRLLGIDYRAKPAVEESEPETDVPADVPADEEGTQ